VEWEELIDVGAAAPAAPGAVEPEPEPEAPGRLRRLRERLRKSREALRAELSASLFEQLDDETWERLEEALILADVGAAATADVVGKLEAEVEAGQVSGAEAVRDRLVELLAELA
jgi:fused signal recognition particle receptor